MKVPLQLSKLTSPKEDVVGELKTMRSTSRQRVEDTIREEAALSADETTPFPTATEDGLATLPPEETILPTEETKEATPRLETEQMEREEPAQTEEPPEAGR